MNVYVDASALLQWLINNTPMPQYKSWQRVCSSELLKNEVARTLHRLRLLREIDDEELVLKQTAFTGIIDQIDFIEITPKIMEMGRAAFGTHIGTLDALHLASALLWREQLGEAVILFSSDDQLRNAAGLHGFQLL